MDDEQLQARLKTAYLVLCLIYLAALLAAMTPEHKRREWKLRSIAWSARVTSRLARRAGVASIAREAATGEQRYELPLLLSLWRVQAEQAHDASRDSR
jgi:hypothetical protein